MKNEKLMEYEGDSDNNHSWSTWNNRKEPEKENWGSWKSEEELVQSWSQHYWDRFEYWEEFWISEEICCHLDLNEGHQLQVVRKILKKVLKQSNIVESYIIFTCVH